MTKALCVTGGWLAAGHAVLAGVFYVLLLVPESNLAMLITSGVLILVLAAGAGLIETTAALAWLPGWTLGAAFQRARRSLLVWLAAIAIFAAVFALGSLASLWWAQHRTEIEAWTMARTGVTRLAWIHAVVGWLVWLLRYAVGVSLAGAALVAGATGGWRAFGCLRWIGRALAPRTWLLTGVALLIFLWLPWQIVYWRPAVLPATALEVVFAGVKLLVIYLVGNAGWALVLGGIARRTADREVVRQPA